MTLALTLQRKNEACLKYGNINHGNQDLAQSKGGTGAAKAHECESADMERLRHDGWQKTTGQTVEKSADEHERPCSTARKNQCSLDKVME
jgi:hypothetical protein